MLANFFSKSKPVNFILIIGLFFTYYLLDSFLYTSGVFSLVLFISIPWYLGVFFLFNFIISKNRLTKDDSYAFLLLVIGLGCLPQLNVSYLILLEYTVLFLFLRRLYSLRTSKIIYEKLFDSGFWLGVLFLMSDEYLMYLILLLVGTPLFVKITFRTTVLPLLGFLTPVFLFFTYHLWFDSLAVFYQLFDLNFNLDFSLYQSSYFAVVLSVFGILTLLAVLLRSGKIISVSNTFKKSWGLLIVHLLIAIASLFLIEEKVGIELIGILIPASILISNWIQSIGKKVIVNGILIMLLLVSVLVHFIV